MYNVKGPILLCLNLFLDSVLGAKAETLSERHGIFRNLTSEKGDFVISVTLFGSPGMKILWESLEFEFI